MQHHFRTTAINFWTSFGRMFFSLPPFSVASWGCSAEIAVLLLFPINFLKCYRNLTPLELACEGMNGIPLLASLHLSVSSQESNLQYALGCLISWLKLCSGLSSDGTRGITSPSVQRREFKPCFATPEIFASNFPTPRRPNPHETSQCLQSPVYRSRHQQRPQGNSSTISIANVRSKMNWKMP